MNSLVGVAVQVHTLLEAIFIIYTLLLSKVVLYPDEIAKNVRNMRTELPIQNVMSKQHGRFLQLMKQM